VWDTATWRFGTRAELGAQGEVELGWTLGREHWGHGYATEAARAVRDWAFRELRLTRLISIIHPDNAASIRVAERLGAHHERDIESGWVAPARIYVHPLP
jgi:RimJ/RimL family protein N-acetyltransferase